MSYRKNIINQKGKMPIGPILIIALIVLPVVLVLVTYGRPITELVNSKIHERADSTTNSISGVNPVKEEQINDKKNEAIQKKTPEKPPIKFSYDIAGLLAVLAALIALIGYSSKRVFKHLESRARLLMLERVSKSKVISRHEARELLRSDVIWFRILMRNLHIDTLDELERTGKIKMDNGEFRIAQEK